MSGKPLLSVPLHLCLGHCLNTMLVRSLGPLWVHPGSPEMGLPVPVAGHAQLRGRRGPPKLPEGKNDPPRRNKGRLGVASPQEGGSVPPLASSSRTPLMSWFDRNATRHGQ